MKREEWMKDAEDMVIVIDGGRSKKGKESEKRWEQQIKWTVKRGCWVKGEGKALFACILHPCEKRGCVSLKMPVSLDSVLVQLLISFHRLPAEMSSLPCPPLWVSCPSNRWAKPTIISGGSVVCRGHTKVSLILMLSWWQVLTHQT